MSPYVYQHSLSLVRKLNDKVSSLTQEKFKHLQTCHHQREKRNISGYTQLPKQVLTSDCKDMGTAANDDISTDWTSNMIHQDLYKLKKIIKKDTCMNLYDTPRPLYLETSASGMVLEAGLLQVLDCMNCRHHKIPDYATLYPNVFTSKSLCSDKSCYNNIECKALGILHGL